MKHSISTGYALLANHIPVLMDLLTLSPIDYYPLPHVVERVVPGHFPSQTFGEGADLGVYIRHVGV